MVDTILTFNRYLLELAPDDWLRRERCLLTASLLVEEIAKLAKRGTLRLMKDTSGCMASSLAVFLKRVSVRSAELTPRSTQRPTPTKRPSFSRYFSKCHRATLMSPVTIATRLRHMLRGLLKRSSDVWKSRPTMLQTARL